MVVYGMRCVSCLKRKSYITIITLTKGLMMEEDKFNGLSKASILIKKGAVKGIVWY